MFKKIAIVIIFLYSCSGNMSELAIFYHPQSGVIEFSPGIKVREIEVSSKSKNVNTNCQVEAEKNYDIIKCFGRKPASGDVIWVKAFYKDEYVLYRIIIDEYSKNQSTIRASIVKM